MSDTKEYIIEQAFSLFLTSSYEAVSISDISNAIGLTKGALYHHFTNKEELFHAVVDKYLDMPQIEVDEETITLHQFSDACISHTKRIIDKIFSHSSGFSPINYISLMADGFRHHSGFAEKATKLMDLETKKIKIVLDKAIERGEIRPDIDTSIIAHSYFSNMIGLAGSILSNYSIDQAMEMLKAQFHQMYNLLKI